MFTQSNHMPETKEKNGRTPNYHLSRKLTNLGAFWRGGTLLILHLSPWVPPARKQRSMKIEPHPKLCFLPIPIHCRNWLPSSLMAKRTDCKTHLVTKALRNSYIAILETALMYLEIWFKTRDSVGEALQQIKADPIISCLQDPLTRSVREAQIYSEVQKM
jgi:hypothetical protein